MKMKCPQCDFENEEGSEFCKNCNLPLFKQDYDEDNPYTKKNIKEEKMRAEIRAFQAEKAEIEKEKKTSPLGADWLVFTIIAIAIFVIYFLPAINSDSDMRNKSPSLALSSEDILFTSETGYYITQCYATNKGNSTWKGSVYMRVQDIEGGYLYVDTHNHWLGIELKPGERDYFAAKIPMSEYLIKYAPQGILVIVWGWGNKEVTKRIKIR